MGVALQQSSTCQINGLLSCSCRWMPITDGPLAVRDTAEVRECQVRRLCCWDWPRE